MIEGQLRRVILEEAADASLLVVGGRGLGGFKAIYSARSASKVVQHASCPVVVHQKREA